MLMENSLDSNNNALPHPTIMGGGAFGQDMSNQINEIALALSKAQSELEAAGKTQEGYGYNYSDLNSVINTAKPVLAKHDLAITQLLGATTDTVTVTTVLVHKSGQFFKSTASLPVVEMKGCNIAQGAGASVSYLRRYSIQAILNMSSEDVDASSNGAKTAPKQKFEKPEEETKNKEGVASGKKGTGFRRGKKPSTDDDL